MRQEIRTTLFKKRILRDISKFGTLKSWLFSLSTVAIFDAMTVLAPILPEDWALLLLVFTFQIAAAGSIASVLVAICRPDQWKRTLPIVAAFPFYLLSWRPILALRPVIDPSFVPSVSWGQ